MKEDSKIEDSLEFCKEIKYYEKKDDPMEFNEKNYPNLKEYIHWMNKADDKVNKDYESYEQAMKEAAAIHPEEIVKKHVHTEAATEEMIPQQSAESVFQKAKQEEKEGGMKSTVLQVLGCLLIAVILVYGTTTFFFTYTRVNGESMDPTLKNHDVVLINRISYRFHDPKQFDTIVFSNDGGVNLVKRVIATPGQTVQIKDGLIYVNDEVVNENYGTEKMSTSGLAAEKLTLGIDEYFVLGDNRNKSTDSRSSYVGMVNKSEIVGKVFFRVYPFKHMGSIE